MAWTAPVTAIAGATVTSADFNTYVRDNLSQTMPAKALNIGSLFAVASANSIVERIPASDLVSASETTASTSYTDLATVGPTVTVTSGTFMIIVVGGRLGPNTTAAQSVKMSWAISGATTRAANDTWAAGPTGLGTSGAIYTSRWYYAGVTAGSNTVQAKYAVSGGTGTFGARSLGVIPL